MLHWIWFNSWRYYTSYDNGEWRRHATPIYKADAEQEIGSSGKLGERRSASMTTGLTTRYDEVDVENGESSSSHSRQTSASGRHQRLRGSASLTRDLPPADTSSATNSGPTTVRFPLSFLTKCPCCTAARVHSVVACWSIVASLTI